MSLKMSWTWFLLIPGIPLMYWAFRDIPVNGLVSWFTGFQSAGVPALIAFEVASWMVMGERWRFFCRMNGHPFSPLRAASARLVGFAWSYITPGPHIGGEAFQVMYVARRGAPAGPAAAALARDRGYELLSGLITVSSLAVLPGGDRRLGWTAAVIAILLTLAAAAIARRPAVFRSVAAAAIVTGGRSPVRRGRIYRFLKATFQPAESGRLRTPGRILLSASLILAPLLTVLELQLFFAFSAAPLNWRNAIVMAAVSRIAHYAPVPGAIGVYDAGMMGAAAWLGLDPAIAAAYVFFTRLRDVLQVGAGLVIGAVPVRGVYGK
jgi:uncharacterized protein (TIRG00374 family)